MALGAPAELLERAAQAQLDEVAHARFAFEQVERLDGTPVQAGALMHPRPRLERSASPSTAGA